MPYKRGDIVTYQSPFYGRPMRARLTVPFHDPMLKVPAGDQTWDVVLINQEGEPDVEGVFFTSAWLRESQIISLEVQ